MRLLVDTHAFFWWLTIDRKLSRRALEALEDEGNEILVSAVVAWELATKSRLGKWPEGHVAVHEMDDFVRVNDLQPLPISIDHGRLAGLLPGRHRDPFDRMLAAQSKIEGVPLVTADPFFRDFGTSTLW
jgi:PIN domain nuclease of toxin-antitoxin system